MAVIPMQKVKILVHQSKKDELMEYLQNEGMLDILDASEKSSQEMKEHFDKEHHKVEYALARVEYAIQFLEKYAEKKGGLRTMLEGDFIKITGKEFKKTIEAFSYNDMVGKVEHLDEQIVKEKNDLKELEEEELILQPWESFRFTLKSAKETEFTKMLMGQIDIRDYELFKTEIIKKTPYVYVQEVSKTETMSFVIVAYLKEIENEVREVLQDFKFTETAFSERSDTPGEELRKIAKSKKEVFENLKKLESEAKKLTAQLPKLKIMYDHLYWSRDKKIARKNFHLTESTESIVGWMPKERIKDVKKKILKNIKEADFYETEREENEMPPVAIKNNRLIEPFESVTGVYGLPLYSEVDPTPYLSAFFIVFFGMCLSDAGYGLTLFALTFFLIKFFDLPPGIRKMMKLLMFGGVLTFVFGILYGGWFGLTVEQAPGFLTSTTPDGILLFKGQLLQPIQNPISILTLAMCLGVIQVWVGIAIDLFWKIKQGQVKDGILDSGTWLYFISALIFYILTKLALVPASLETTALYLIYAGLIILILTQGRNQKNIIGKLGIGILSLYNLVGYLSDILSYSRLLALGLATGIIAMAVNIIAVLMKDMIPYFGWVLMILILLGGHVFNLAISALGSFIHSSRLQFVEFFGKFMEGGGTDFKPLMKVCKYVRIIIK